MRMTVLVTGATGMLGQQVVSALQATSQIRVVATGRSRLVQPSCEYLCGDLTDKDFIAVIRDFARYDAIVHCAAEVNLQTAENQPEWVERIHVNATKMVASELKNALFIYISTDSVFDGRKGNYAETDSTNPLNHYARTKLEGEHVVQQYAAEFYILRTNIYGLQSPLKNSLAEWAYKQLVKSIPVSGYSNVYFNPLYIKQLAAVVRVFIEKRPERGIYNAVSDQAVSKYAFIRKLADKWGFSPDLVSPVEADYEGIALKRPYNTVLNNQKLKSLFPEVSTDLDSGIEWMCRDYKPQAQ